MITKGTTDKYYILQRLAKESPDDFTFVYGSTRFGIINESDGEMELGRTVANHQIGHISLEQMKELNQIPPNELPDSDRFNYKKLSEPAVNSFLKGYYYVTRMLEVKR